VRSSRRRSDGRPGRSSRAAVLGLGATSGVAANPAIAVFASKLTASDRTDVAYAMTFPTSTIMKIVLIQVMLAMMGQP